MLIKVKYIGYAIQENLDISLLYQKELAQGQSVLLICEKQRWCNASIDLSIYTALEQLPESWQGVRVLLGQEDARLLAIQAAAKLKAGMCQVFIGQPGFYTADPRQLEIAQKLEKIDYDEAMEVSSSGYSVVNNAMVELAKRQGIAIELISYQHPQQEGTFIKEVLATELPLVKGVIKDPNIAIITLQDIPDQKGISYKIFKSISDAGIVVDIILLPATTGTMQDISFTVRKDDKIKVEKILQAQKEEIGFSQLKIDDHVAKVSVIGAGMQNSFGVATTVFRVLYENDINLKLINTSEIKIAVVVDKVMADLAVHKIHEAFIK